MAFNEKEQQIIRWGLENGKSKDEVQGALLRFRTTGSPSDPTKVSEEEAPVTERVGEVISEAGEEVAKITAREDRTLPERAIQATARAVRAVPEVALEVSPEPVRKGVEKVGEFIGKGVQKLADFLGGTEFAQELVTKHPGLAEDIERVAETTAAAGEIAGTTVGVRGILAGTKLGLEGAKNVAKGSAERFRNISPEITSQGDIVRRNVTSSINPETLMQRVVRVSKGNQTKFASQHGESIGKYLVDRGIIGTTEEVADELFKRFRTSKGVVDRELVRLDGKFKNSAVKNALDDLLAREERISRPGVPSQDLELVRELTRKHRGGGLTMDEINQAKRLYERNVKLDFVKENLPDKIAEANNIDQAIRKFQFNKADDLGFKNIAELNKETQKAFQLLDLVGKEMAGQLGNNAITLTDWILLAEATGNPTALATLLGKKALTSELAQSKLAKFIQGKGEPKVGQPKAIRGEKAKGLQDIGN